MLDSGDFNWSYTAVIFLPENKTEPSVNMYFCLLTQWFGWMIHPPGSVNGIGEDFADRVAPFFG